MESLKVRLTGTTPLIVHNGRLANPLDPIVKEIKEITGKKKKTDDDYAQLFKLEFVGSLFVDDKIGPYLPGIYFSSHLCDAAKLARQGKDVQRALLVLEEKSPIEYKGPRTPEAMFKDKSFVDIRAVKIKTSKTMRCRPIFHEWATECTVMFYPEVLNRSAILSFLTNGGKYLGFADGRPYYGRYEHKVVE